MSAGFKFELKIDKNVSELERAILNEYWKIEDGLLVNSPRDIAKKYDFRMYQLPKLVSAISLMKIEFQCPKCKESIIKKEVTSKTGYDAIYRNIKNNKEICQICDNQIKELEREKRELEKKKRELEANERNEYLLKKQSLLEKKFESLKIGDLNRSERYLLREIVNCEGDGKKVFFYLMRNDLNISWKELLRLDEREVIYVERDDNNHIKQVFYPTLLLKGLDDYYDRNMSNFSERDNASMKKSNRLSVTLEANPIFKEGRPLYHGLHVFDGEIAIKPNIEYSIALWKTVNNEVRFSLIPKDEIVECKKISLCNEPKPVRDLINGFWEGLRSKDNKREEDFFPPFDSFNSNDDVEW